MTLRELFKKVEAYNEIAELMGTDKAKIVLTTTCHGFTQCEGTFQTYKDFTKFVKEEYFPDVANGLIKSKDWEIDGDITFNWGWNEENTAIYGAELTAL